MDTVSFTAMADGTREDYQLLGRLEHEYCNQTAERVLATLRQLDQSMSGYQVSRLEHSLQSATRAARDGADEEMVVAALLHDIGDTIAPHNHSELAAAMLKPFVSERTHWIILHHGLFQGYYYFHHLGGDRHARDRYRDHPWFQDCVDFCERYDQCAFDPSYDTLPLTYFEPMVHRLFARAPFEHDAHS